MAKRTTVAWSVALGLAGWLPGQDASAELVAKVKAGGWFEATKFRRADDGVLEGWSTAHTGDPELGEFVPLVGRIGDADFRFGNLGLFGVLSLLCHGDADLLAMTDAEFHFAALGLGTSDAELRQFLVLPAGSFAGARGRAELLDRLLVIDRLLHRQCRAAVAELTALAAGEDLPAVLRQRAGQARDLLQGKTVAAGRRRLDPAVLRLPAAFDAAVVIDHARLPNLRWLTPLARRTGALATAHAIEQAGGTISVPMCSGAQRLCDIPAEAPFWVAHQWGNARLDHSLVTVTVKADGEMPVALSWNAVGEFEHERWAAAELPEGAAADNPLFAGSLTVGATTLYASTDGSQGRPRPAMAEELLRGEGPALRVVVTANSKLWPMLAALQLPPAQGGELRVTFGEPTVVVFAVEARDDEAAEAWVAKGKDLLAQERAAGAALPPALAGHADVQALRAAWLAASFSCKEATAFAVVELRGFTAPKLWSIAEALAAAMF